MKSTYSKRITIITIILTSLTAIAVNANWGSGFGSNLFSAKDAATAVETSVKESLVQLPPAAMTTPLNAVTSFDLGLVTRHISGAAGLTSNEQRVAADASGNCTLSSTDTIPMIQYITGSGTGGTIGTTLSPPGPCGALPISVAVVRGDVSAAPPATTSGSGTATVSLPDVTATPGLIIVPITVSDLTGLGVLSYDIQVDFNSAIVTPSGSGVSNAGTLSSSMSINSRTANAGHLIISAITFSTTPLSGSGTLLNLQFNVVGTAGQSTALTFADYTDPVPRAHQSFLFNEGLPDAVMTNGSVTIGEPPTATATDTPTPAGTATNTPTNTPTDTPTPAETATPTATDTPTSTPTATPVCEPPPSGIIGWWPGDLHPSDISGNGNNGTLNNGAGFGSGYVAPGFLFDGFNQNVVIPDVPVLNPSSAISIEAWIYPTGGSGQHRDILSKDGENSERQYLLTISVFNRVRGHVNTSNNPNFPLIDGATNVPLNVWTHAAMTYDGTELKVYMNGVLDGSIPVTGSILTTTQPVRIGGGAPGCCQQLYFPGSIDEPTIYDRALTQTEITALYDAGTAGKCKPPACTPFFVQNFDSVTAPALPAGWVATNVVPGPSPAPIMWTTATTNPLTAPNSAFVDDADAISDKYLDSPGILISSASALLSFGNNFNTESLWDGGVLEISSPNINAGAFTDVTDPAVGGSFVTGGYTGMLNTPTSNPLGARMTWTGNSGGYINTVVNLGPNVAGQTINLRFRMGTDHVIGAPGWWIDSIAIADQCSVTPTNTPTATPTPAETPSVGGTVAYGNPASPTTKLISNATVASTVGSPPVTTVTDAPGGTAGQYTLTGFGSGSYTIGVTKTTGQNGISSADAARIAQHVSGISIITSARQLIAADVTNNGAISSTDAAQIARFVTALGPPIGLANQWRFFVPNVSQPTFPIGASPTNRSYEDPIDLQTGQDYIGILVGEVTGNWNPTAARPGTVNSGKWTVDSESIGPERGIAVELPSFGGSVDKEIVVPVSVQGIANRGVISYEFDLRYDSSVMQPVVEPVDVSGTVSRGLSVVTNATEPGLLRVVVYGAYPIDGDGVLLNLRFTSVGAVGSVSPISFERIMFNEGESRIIVTDGKVELAGL